MSAPAQIPGTKSSRIRRPQPPIVLRIDAHVGYDSLTNRLWVSFKPNQNFSAESEHIAAALVALPCPECPKLDLQHTDSGLIIGLVVGPLLPCLRDGGDAKLRELQRSRRYNKATTLSHQLYRSLRDIGIHVPELNPRRVTVKFCPQSLAFHRVA